MVALQVLSGTAAGKSCVARRFPFRIGRSPSSDMQLEADGVWQEHGQIEFDPSTGFVLVAAPDALALVNGAPIQRGRLASGDVIEIGAVKMTFALAPPTQTGLAFREIASWSLIAVLIAAEVVVLVALAR